MSHLELPFPMNLSSLHTLTPLPKCPQRGTAAGTPAIHLRHRPRPRRSNTAPAEMPAARAPPPPPVNARRSETLMDTIPTRHSTRSTRRGLEPAPRVVPTPESQLSQPMPFP
ncbi:7422_t:CDS:2, partial [Scutellospora calospora]